MRSLEFSGEAIASRFHAVKCLFVSLMFASMATSSIRSHGQIRPTADEMHKTRAWVDSHFSGSNPDLPFSFTFNSKPSALLIKHWPSRSSVRHSEAHHTTRVWHDHATGLEVRYELTAWSDFPVVEWTVYLKNTGSVNTPILENLQGLDAELTGDLESGGGQTLLHGLKGDYCVAESYEPYQLPIEPGFTKSFGPPNSGKSCDGPEGWPYFNVQGPDKGVIVAVGWPGQWSATVSRDSEHGVWMTAGQKRTHLYLKPGEEIRTPRISLLFWSGKDIDRSQNLWRRWYMAHVIPRTGGKPQGPISQIQVDGSVASIADAKAVLDSGIKPDICWRDAGGGDTWYPSKGGPYKGGDGWLNTGTWEVDPVRYPQGFRPYSDWVRAHGMQFLLWFEPERVGDPNSWLGKTHPEWLLPGSSHGGILNLGDHRALTWLEDHIDGMIKTQGLDWYREDMNGVGPAPAWRQADAKDRQGITENLYVQGHLAFWDTLRARNPRLRIDSCASGGRRNDLETMRRAVPLLRSDFQFPDMPGVIEGNQAQTYGLSAWLPFQGTGCYFPDLYALRSFYLAGFGTVGTSSLQKQAYTECANIAPLMLADYYPLTAYSRDLNRWIAWEFNKPETGEGAVQAFRRKDCDTSGITLVLHGLDANATYELNNFDTPGAVTTATATGKTLMTTGLTIEIKSAPGAAIITYSKRTRRTAP